MKITISTVNEYIPEWNKNRDMNKNEQIVVVHKAVTPAAKELMIPKNFTGGLEIDRRRLLEHLDLRIINLTLVVDGKEKKIETVADLYSAPIELDGVIAELFGYFFNEITSGKLDRKKSA